MNNSFKHFLPITGLILLYFSVQPAFASHLAGQDFTYAFIDSSGSTYHYRVTFTLYADCLHGNPVAILADNPIILGTFDGSGAIVQLDTGIYYSSSSTVSSSALPCTGDAFATYCKLKRTFIKDYYLPASASGYIIAYQRCCWNNLDNIYDGFDTSTTATCTIPPYSVATHNSSAIFNNYPPFSIHINAPFVFNSAATDPDGDSLSYDLCMPFTYIAANISPYPAPPPYPDLAYVAPFSYSNPMSCSVPLSINPATGVMTGTPNALGTYLVTVCCHEWRHGSQINSIQRTFELIVGNCGLGVPMPTNEEIKIYPNPAFSSMTVSAGEEIHHININTIMGKSVYDQQCHSQQETIDVSLLPAGLYFIKINNTAVRKFIKQ